MTDLLDKITFSGCEALNKTSSTSIDNVLKQGLRDQDTLLLESDADDQLLLRIVFNTKVKLHSIAIGAPSDGRAPKEVKLFANRNAMDFNDAEQTPATQALEFTPEMLGERVELKFVSFQNVDSVTIFVASNQDDCESSALTSLKLWGTGMATTNMGDFKRVAGEAGEGE